MMKYNHIYNGTLAYAVSLLVVFCIFSCADQEYAIPTLKQEFQNDIIKRTLGPNVAGLDIEFAYAMALPPERGKIISAQVEASIAGAEGTYLENKSYHTAGNGMDVGIVVGEKSVTEGSRSTVKFTVDTCAATLRYYYRIPEAAKGKSVSFTFSAQASTGERVSYNMGPYEVASMDMKLDIPVIDGESCYISVENMAVYTAGQATANPGKIDLLYLYRNIPNVTFNHSLVSPSADSQYLPGVTLPPGLNRSTKIRKAWGIRDRHLARLQYGIYIDDLDFQQLDVSNAPDYAINMRAESGAWIETADGRYRAYIYFNSVNNNTRRAVISIKRYTL